ncbi:uncharacterized protein LOC126800281 isoform X2 [Argentina anserina]|uniref:uncharacterized protein LOC126800281 isoform X1 n=1 Tax=Argentina anserina TaxID=57926 RepID=UPI0021768E85|nr:uncharacterized protein LOC126800281 isoform X1 [Potentilla anserina]XP_050383568.1 uncharacterized protein LOC126800281 isoform X2 [Potentilla anserina]
MSPRVVPPIKLTGSTSSIFWATPCTPATTTHGVATAGSYCCGGAASSGHHGSRFLGGFVCLSPSNIPTKGIEPNRSVTDETSEEITFRVVEVARRKEVDNSAGVD